MRPAKRQQRPGMVPRMPARAFVYISLSILLLASGTGGTAERGVLSGEGMTSKLGLLFLGGQPSQNLLSLIDSGSVPIMKIPAVDFASPGSIGLRLKKANPRSIIVVGVGAQGSDMKTERDPAEIFAQWAREKEGDLKILQAHRDKVDYLSFMPNMWEPKTVEQARWYCRYIAIAAPRVAEMGFRPVILQSGVGGLPDIPEILDAMVPAFRTAMRYGGAWASHGYTLEYTKDVEKESWTSLRHRRAYSHLRKAHPDVADLTMLLMEGGVDKAGDPDKDGWQARGTQRQFTDWLKWYDSEIRKDPYVIGVCLFKIGDPGSWKSFDLEPVTPWLREYYRERTGSSTGDSR